MIKGTRVINLQVDLTVELGEVEYSTLDEWSELYHDRDTMGEQKRKLTKAMLIALNQAGIEVQELNVGRVELDIINDEENDKLTEALHNASHEEWERRRAAVDEALAQAGMPEFPFCCSLDDGEEDAIIAGEQFPQAGRFQLYYDGGWGHPCASNILEDLSWRQVVIEAAKLIYQSGDGHHIFLEGIINKGVDDNGLTMYHIVTGS